MTKTMDIHHQLVKRLKNGDQEAAKDIYERYSKAMYNTLIRLTGNPMDAQDLLQESFVKAFKGIHSFREEATFGAWLKRIVVNTALAHFRSKKIEFNDLEEEAFDQEDSYEEEVDIDPALIHEQIKKLPSGSRTVLSLYLLEGYTHKEIAAELGITESTSKTQYMRGKNMLKQLLKDKIYGV